MADTEYLDPDGTTWNSYESSITIGLCGLCGCGRESIKDDLIAIIRDTDEIVKIPDDPYHELLLHVLDHADLLEHGTSIRGSWLSEKGRAVQGELRRRAAE